MTTAQQLLDVARSQLGVKEQPQGSNRTAYGEWYGVNGAPWCAIFGAWVNTHSGLGDPRDVYNTGPRGWQYCPAILNVVRRAGIAVDARNAQPGDALLFNWPGGDSSEHYGICESNSGTGLVTIEGNTSLGSDANGGMVMRRGRSYGLIVSAVRFPFSNPAPVPPPPPPALDPAVDWAALRRALAAHWLPVIQGIPDLHPGDKSLAVAALQEALNLVSGAGLVVDGEYGNATAAAVGYFQRFFDITQDSPLNAERFTRFYLVTALQNIADGRA